MGKPHHLPKFMAPSETFLKHRNWAGFHWILGGSCRDVSMAYKHIYTPYKHTHIYIYTLTIYNYILENGWLSLQPLVSWCATNCDPQDFEPEKLSFSEFLIMSRLGFGMGRKWCHRSWAPWTFKPAFFRNNDGYLMGVCIYIWWKRMDIYQELLRDYLDWCPSSESRSYWFMMIPIIRWSYRPTIITMEHHQQWDVALLETTRNHGWIGNSWWNWKLATDVGLQRILIGWL